MSPRRYDSSRRQLAAEATRVQVLEAARSIIGGQGDLDAFSMELVAAKAGVARMTVYHQFGSRAGLLEGLADHLAARGRMDRLRGAFLEPDPEKAVRTFVRTFVGFWASDRVTLRRLRAMAVVFPVQDRGPRERDRWRTQAARNLLERLPSPASIPEDGLTREDLADLVSSLTSFETYDGLLVSGRSEREATELLVRAVRRLVLPNPDRPAGAPNVAGSGARRRAARRATPEGR